MSESNRKKIGTLMGVAALVLGTFGLMGALQKQKSDAERDALLAQKELRIAQLEADRHAVVNSAIAALRESTDRGYAVLDADGCVVEWNATLAKWSGYTIEEMRGHNLLALMAPEKQLIHEHGYAALMADDKSLKQTYVIECDLVPKEPGKPTVRVTVAARIVKTKSGDKFGVALIDKAANVVGLSDRKHD